MDSTVLEYLNLLFESEKATHGFVEAAIAFTRVCLSYEKMLLSLLVLLVLLVLLALFVQRKLLRLLSEGFEVLTAEVGSLKKEVYLNTPFIMPQALVLDEDTGAETDYVLNIKEGFHQCWVTAEQISVNIIYDPKVGVEVKLFSAGGFMEPLASTMASIADADAAETIIEED